jgi:ABC-type nitrate/sulfonate/bicarbonate transport system substrate-binding protein
MRLLRIAVTVILLALALGPAAPGGGAATLDRVRIIFDPTFYSHLPILRAIDAGYFRDEGIDLQLTPSNGSSTAFLPMLARGDFDLGTANPSPAFFNQFSAGFNVVLLAGQTGSRAGWHDSTWLMVRQDLWDTKAIRVPADLRGKNVDGANVGSPIDFLLKETIRSGGLTLGDLRVGERYKSPADALEGLKNHAVDVVGINEPAASQIEAQGFAHRWLSFDTVAPWYQPEYLAASAQFAKEHPTIIKRFLRAYLRGNDDILKSGGKWTPMTIAEAVKRTGLSADVLRGMPGPTYPATHGDIDLDALTRMQQFWIEEKLVTTPVDVKSVADLTSLHDVQRSLGYIH